MRTTKVDGEGAAATTSSRLSARAAANSSPRSPATPPPPKPHTRPTTAATSACTPLSVCSPRRRRRRPWTRTRTRTWTWTLPARVRIPPATTNPRFVARFAPRPPRTSRTRASRTSRERRADDRRASSSTSCATPDSRVGRNMNRHSHVTFRVHHSRPPRRSPDATSPAGRTRFVAARGSRVGPPRDAPPTNPNPNVNRRVVSNSHRVGPYPRSRAAPRARPRVDWWSSSPGRTTRWFDSWTRRFDCESSSPPSPPRRPPFATSRTRTKPSTL